MASMENALALRDSVGLTDSSGRVSGLTDDVTTSMAHMTSKHERRGDNSGYLCKNDSPLGFDGVNV